MIASASNFRCVIYTDEDGTSVALTQPYVAYDCTGYPQVLWGIPVVFVDECMGCEECAAEDSYDDLLDEMREWLALQRETWVETKDQDHDAPMLAILIDLHRLARPPPLRVVGDKCGLAGGQQTPAHSLEE